MTSPTIPSLTLLQLCHRNLVGAFQRKIKSTSLSRLEPSKFQTPLLDTTPAAPTSSRKRLLPAEVENVVIRDDEVGKKRRIRGGESGESGKKRRIRGGESGESGKKRRIRGLEDGESGKKRRIRGLEDGESGKKRRIRSPTLQVMEGAKQQNAAEDPERCFFFFFFFFFFF